MYKKTLFFLLVGIFTISASFSQTILLKEDFTNYDGTSSSTPSGWTISTHSAYTTSSYCGPSGINSFRFSDNNVQVICPVFSSVADSVKFWMKLVSGSQASKLIMEGYLSKISQWDTLIEIDSLPTSGTLRKFKLDSTTTQLRFTYIKSSGNLAFDDFSITTSKAGDFVAPVITLLGSNPMSVVKDSPFIDPGATALDNQDGDITNKITVTGSVNTSLPGTYLVQYNVSDLAGNPAIEAIRTVNVVELDLIPPVIIMATPADANNLDVFFSEPMDSATTQNSINYSVNIIGSPVSTTIDPDNDSLVHLNFSSSFTPNQEYTLSISGVKDINNNMIQSNSTVKFTYTIPSPKDVIISEIMFDPDPQVGLPNSEFIELYNKSQKKINLSGWEFTDGSTYIGILKPYILNPGKYLVLCPTASFSSFTTFGSVMGLDVYPSLNNSGDNLALTDNKGTVIDKVSYFPSWMKNSSKEEGGWSLEIINPDNPCSSADNWIASVSATGGTPGMKNSVFSSTLNITPSKLIGVTVLSSNKIKLVFSESLEKTSFADIIYSVLPSNPIIKDSINNELNYIYLSFKNDFALKTINKITVSGFKDCWGNVMTVGVSKYFAIGEKSDSMDIVINEVLFEPKKYGSDFVELYNRSDKFIELKNWQLANTKNDSVYTKITIADEPYTLFPKSYVVITTNKKMLEILYPQAIDSTILDLSYIPSFSSSSGGVVLLRDDNKISDWFNYSYKMHFALLDNKQGVSLERVSAFRPTNELTNWHSAATTAKYATPGFANSQGAETRVSSEEFYVTPGVFTPDNDGKNDFTTIGFNFEQAGAMGILTIYDVMGRKIKSIASNELLGKSGNWPWDGTTDDNTKARVGYYIVYFEVYNLEGKTKSFKKTVVVGARF